MSSSLYADEPGIPVSSDPRFKLPKRFTELRPAQLLIAEQAAALLSSGTDIVLVEAKVGFGKSLFAELVRQLLQTRMVMVVPRIDLQRQFLESFPQSRLLQGRTNFPHGGVDGRRDFPRVTCADCKEMHFCKNTGCMYKEAKNDFMSASVGVTNVSYFMAAANYLNMFLPGNDKKPRPGQQAWTGDYLTVFDEADTLEDNLLKFIGCTVHINYIKHVIEVCNMTNHLQVPYPPVRNFEKWPIWLEEAKRVLNLCLKKFGAPDKRDIQEVRWHTRLVKTIMSLNQVKEDWIYDPERVEGKTGRKTGEAWKVSLNPLMVGELGMAALWNHCGKTVAMSGSFTSLNIWLEEVGLDKSDKKIEFLKSDPNWDPSHCRVHRVPGVKMVKTDRKKRWKDQEFWDEWVGRAAQILLRYPNERCLIHAHSHELSQDIGDSLAEIFGDRIICDRGDKVEFSDDDTPEEREDKLAKNECLARYLKTPGAVLISAKLGRGTDLYDGRCRNIIIAKTPFPYLGDRRIMARLKTTKSGELYYMIKSVRETVQDIGRGRRHRIDWVRVWIIDDCFDQVASLKGLLPPDLSKSIMRPGDYMSKFPPLKEMEP